MEAAFLRENCILCKARIKPSDGTFKEHLLKKHFGPIVINKPTVFEDKTSQSSDIELITHISMRYRPNKTETYLFDNYSCPHCMRKFSAKSGLKIHVGIAHKGGKVIFCSRCPSAFADVSSCKSHFKEEHSLSSKKRKIQNLTVEESVEPHKSMVPTNLPVEGCEKIQNNNNQDQQTSDINQNNNPGTNQKKKPKKPLPGLVKINDFNPSVVGEYVVPSPLIDQSQASTVKPITNHEVSSTTSISSITSLPAPPQQLVSSTITVKPIKPILPNTKNYQAILPNPQPSQQHVMSAVPRQPSQQQVYVPAMTNSGTTILLKIEEAQRHLNAGVVKFLPSNSNNTTTTTSQSTTSTAAATTTAQATLPLTQHSATSKESETDKSQNIMKEKVALNLPVVMTKRTNKKLAQDNPFYKVRMDDPEAGLEAECRTCSAMFMFNQTNSKLMVQHYHNEHQQVIQINTFPLYFEILQKLNKVTVKWFLCAFCAKEFTTK